MMELFYPVENAPAIGSREACEEMLPVVDTVGRVFAQSSRQNCHSQANPLMHPVVHLEVVDRFSRFYLQRRSASKEKYPLRWDIAVGGHVTYGESYGEALYREAWEEIRLDRFNPQFLANYVSDFEADTELVNLYVTIGTFTPVADNYEVCDGRYWTMEEIDAALGRDVFTPDFELEYTGYKDKILALL